MSNQAVTKTITVDPFRMFADGPRTFQKFIAAGTRRAKRSCVICCRQVGKTFYVLYDVMWSMLTCKELFARFIIVAPTEKQCRKLYWDDLVDLYGHLEWVDFKKQEGVMYLDRPWMGDRVKLTLYGQSEGIRGLTRVKKAWIDEATDIDIPDIQSTVEPTLKALDGSIMYTGTTHRYAHFYDMYPIFKLRENEGKSYFGANFNVYDLDVYTKAEINDFREAYSDTPGKFEGEMLNMPLAASEEKVYGNFLMRMKSSGRVSEIRYDASQPVFATCDIGQNAAIVVFQVINGNVHIIDHKETWSYDNNNLFSLFSDLMMMDKYRFQKVFFPWDASVKSGFSGESVKEQARKLFGNLSELIIMPKGKHGSADQDRIRAVIDAQDKFRFKESKTNKLIRHLGRYEYKKAPGGGYTDQPIGSRHSHSADAFAMVAQVFPKLGAYQPFNMQAPTSYLNSLGANVYGEIHPVKTVNDNMDKTRIGYHFAKKCPLDAF